MPGWHIHHCVNSIGIFISPWLFPLYNIAALCYSYGIPQMGHCCHWLLLMHQPCCVWGIPLITRCCCQLMTWVLSRWVYSNHGHHVITLHWLARFTVMSGRVMWMLPRYKRSQWNSSVGLLPISVTRQPVRNMSQLWHVVIGRTIN